jgi:hypothetical protein
VFVYYPVLYFSMSMHACSPACVLKLNAFACLAHIKHFSTGLDRL